MDTVSGCNNCQGNKGKCINYLRVQDEVHSEVIHKICKGLQEYKYGILLFYNRLDLIIALKCSPHLICKYEIH